MTPVRNDYSLSQLDVLEAESVHIIREVAAEFERPVLLFSGGKDSAVMLRLAEKAFSPAPIDRKSTRLNSSHVAISYAVFCLKKKNTLHPTTLIPYMNR